MASTFRASPWVTYQPQVQDVVQHPPDPAGTTMIMDMDVDMEAPQISTLREEASPPPAKKAAVRKLKAPKLKVTESWTQPLPERKTKAALGEDGEEQADEEDQLIDDDDALGQPSSSVTLPASSAVDLSPKKKLGPKKKTKKEKAVAEDAIDSKKSTENSSSQPSGALSLAPPMQSWYQFKLSDTSHTSTDHPESSSRILVEGSSAPPEPIILKLSTAGKKKQVTPRKTASTPRGRGRGAKVKTALAPHTYAEDAAMSETGYTGTAPSSPGTAHMDLPEINDPGTPEIDNTTVAPSSPPAAPVPLPDEANLEGVAIPQYPLPTKPFPVQPPIKIATGFAPPIPIDKSIKKVRRWRTANREIRGIAGGRWFTKAWVGEKESEYASSAGDEKVMLPGGASMAKLSGLSVSAPPGKGRGRGSKAASVVASAVPSRAGSVGPDGPGGVVRPPTKMRILQLAPSENGDSDMAPPDS